PTTNTMPTWTWTASTDSGVGLDIPAYTVQWSSSSDFSSGNSASTATSNSFTHTDALSDGTWYFRVKATDDLNNETSYTSAGSVVVDTTSPAAPGTPSTTNPTNSTSQNWSWTAGSDAGSGVANYAWRIVTNLGAAVSNGTTTATSLATNLTQGVYSFFVKTVDNVSNQSSESSGSVTVDTDAPVITFPALSPDPTTDTTPTFTGSATDNLTNLTAIQYKIDSGSWTSCAAATGSIDSLNEDFTCTAATLSDGDYTVSVRATDTAGNTTSGGAIATDTFTVDATAPTTPSNVETASSSDDSTPTWSWTSSTDAGEGLGSPAYTVQWASDSGFTTSVSSSTANSTTFTHSTPLSVGTWYFRVKAKDTLENESGYSSAGSFNYTGQLAVSNVQASATSTSVTITWSTNIAASTQLFYGLADPAELSTSETDTSPRTTSHSVTLNSLAPCTLYKYITRSESAASNEATSDTSSFVTDGCVGDTEVYEQTAEAVEHTEEKTITLSITGSQTAAITVPVDVTLHSSLVFQLFRLSKEDVLAETGIPSGYSSIVNAHVYELRALSDISTPVTSFDQPVTFTINYTDAGISGYQESSLVLMRWDGSAWQALTGCTQDTTANTISCTTTSFSPFAMFGVATPQATNSGSSSRSTSRTTSTVCRSQAPSSVPQIYQINVTRGSAQLYINPASGETTEYAVVYGLTPDQMMYSTTFAQTRPTGAIVHTINLLSPNTTYYFKVQAKNGCAATDFSTVFGARTTRFFWQTHIMTTSLGVPVATPAQSAAPAAPITGINTSTVTPVQDRQVSPVPIATPRPTPTADTTQTIPSPTDVTPPPPPNFWQTIKNTVTGWFK
ncbi:MAG: hypothetical protein QG639_118, partial [Patescibacteria group bacterium]|nr:hypothetical protein [Patescibacteria group bacterium]